MLAAPMFLFCLLALVPRAEAQLFGGLGMMDFETARDSYFKFADANGDFALSGEEQMSAISSGFARMAWARSPDLFECDDSDGDGLCSYSEFLDSGQTLFDQLDKNSDGRLTPDEVQ
jgi:hypothetical protein